MTENVYDLRLFLPTTKKEMELRGWESVDVVLFSGDAYVDHPAFGAAVISRVLEYNGLKVAIVPQPNWRDDLRDFKKFGKPNLFFAVSAGSMDSMVNHYTANRRLRSNDAYSPNDKAGFRPDYATITYCNILKDIYPDVPIVIGGIEASLRRLGHYDYWKDEMMPSILVDSKADLLIYGMGEKPIIELVEKLKSSPKKAWSDKWKSELNQVAFLTADNSFNENASVINSYEDCKRSKFKSAEAFKTIEEESNKMTPNKIVQPHGDSFVVVNQPTQQMTTEELDAIYALPFTRLPHPKYKGKRIPAYEMIQHSINIHRGCFGGCAFCTISMHQGKFIISRSQKSIIEEVKKVVELPSFRGYLSDLGGPSANMYKMKGKEIKRCEKCRRPSCIVPTICNNLNLDHAPLIKLYREVDSIPAVKKSFIGSGVRYDMLLAQGQPPHVTKSFRDYSKELITKHVSGRLKVAPEHTEEHVLKVMRKPSFDAFKKYKVIFDEINKEHNLNQQIIPYFISSHPGCNMNDMNNLSRIVKKLDLIVEQVQDFTPTPMTLATEMYQTGVDPYTMKSIFVAKDKQEKLKQRGKMIN